MKKILLLLIFIVKICTINAQASSYTDPAQVYVKLLLEKNPMEKIRVGPYSVIGTPNLFGDNLTTIIYFKKSNSVTTTASYNTYTQDLEINQNGKLGSYHIDEIDSFYLEPHPINKEEATAPMFFINGYHIYTESKFYYQQVYRGNRFCLYKKYYSDLGYVSTNIVQSELRQFDLKYDYYYTDTITKKLKKIKLSNASVIKEFKKIKNVSNIIGDEQIIANPEAILTKIILYLNE